MSRPTAVAAVALFAPLLIASSAFPSQGHHTLKVATYNTWNVMFNWEVRKHHIADMIQAADIDLVAFQEVRADQDKKRTQLLQLKELLPDAYRWQAYHPVQRVIPHKGAPEGWQMEGLGILSRHPIASVSTQSLTHQSPKDKNQRMVLHVTVHLSPSANVSLAVVHLSYDRWQQCVNIAEIMKHIRDTRPVNSIILGDFNTYTDYPWTVEGLLYGYFSTSNKCPKYAAQKNPTAQVDLVTYVDAWTEVNPNKNGFTFSNMPYPGFQSRPDQILFASKSWQVVSCESLGLGRDYAKRFAVRIFWARLAAVLRAAEGAFYRSPGPKGCLHDCGPHGSCRCGICVSGGDKNRCEAPATCPECTAGVYRSYLVWKALLCALVLQFAASAVLLVRQLRSRRSRVLSAGSLRACCCPTLAECHPASLIRPQSPLAKQRLMHLWRIVCPLLSLQPKCQLLLCCACFVLLGIVTPHLFQDSLRIVYAVLPEELNPSDHLMVVATATLKN